MNFVAHVQPKPLNSVTQNQVQEVLPIPIKTVQFVDGEPIVKWTEAEVTQTNTIENLQYAVVSKFSYGCTYLEDLRK